MKIEFDNIGWGQLKLDADTEAEEKLIKKWYKQIIEHLEKLDIEKGERKMNEDKIIEEHTCDYDAGDTMCPACIQSERARIIEIIKNWSGIVNKEELLKDLGEK